MLPVPIATYPDTFFGKFGHAPDRLGVEGQRLLPQLVFQERLTLNSAQSRGLGASLLGVGVNSLGPSDLTEAKNSWSGNRPLLLQRPPKNETHFWTARGTFGIYMDPQEKRILVNRCYHWIALALSSNLI